MQIDENADSVTSVVKYQPIDEPKNFKLFEDYPNPANPTATIAYSLPYRSNASLIVYDILGRKLRELSHGVQNSGEQKLVFDGSDLASGVYLVVLETPLGRLAKKIVLIK